MISCGLAAGINAGGPLRLEAVPLVLEDCHTRLADGDDRAWIRRRFTEAWAGFGTTVAEGSLRLVVTWDRG